MASGRSAGIPEPGQRPQEMCQTTPTLTDENRQALSEVLTAAGIAESFPNGTPIPLPVRLGMLVAERDGHRSEATRLRKLTPSRS
jgi:hypothetical protein